VADLSQPTTAGGILSNVMIDAMLCAKSQLDRNRTRGRRLSSLLFQNKKDANTGWIRRSKEADLLFFRLECGEDNSKIGLEKVIKQSPKTFLLPTNKKKTPGPVK